MPSSWLSSSPPPSTCFSTRTDLGKALRAAADDPEAASYQGINVRAMHGVAFGVGIALVAAAGGLLATYYPIEPNVAVNFIVLMFVAVVLGGLGQHSGRLRGRARHRARAVAHAARSSPPAPERGRLRGVPARALRPAARPLRPPRADGLSRLRKNPTFDGRVGGRFGYDARNSHQGGAHAGRRSPAGRNVELLSPEQRVPADHPLRPIRAMVTRCCVELSPQFDKIYPRSAGPRSRRRSCCGRCCCRCSTACAASGC